MPRMRSLARPDLGNLGILMAWCSNRKAPRYQPRITSAVIGNTHDGVLDFHQKVSHLRHVTCHARLSEPGTTTERQHFTLNFHLPVDKYLKLGGVSGSPPPDDALRTATDCGDHEPQGSSYLRVKGYPCPLSIVYTFAVFGQTPFQFHSGSLCPLTTRSTQPCSDPPTTFCAILRDCQLAAGA